MRKFSAILFLTVSLFAYTECKQLLKLPEFFVHLQQHRAEDSSLSLMEFLKIHYLNKTLKDSDWQEDMKLPFKGELNMFAAVVLSAPPQFPVLQNPTKLFGEEKNYKEFVSSAFLSQPEKGIWQPPRI